MKEKDIQRKFKHYLDATWQGGSAAFELKYTKTDTLPRSALAPHQRQSLLNAKSGMLYHKISDAGIGHKPFDCFVIQDAKAYIVIQFKSGCCLVDINAYCTATETKPLTYVKALEVGYKLW